MANTMEILVEEMGVKEECMIHYQKNGAIRVEAFKAVLEASGINRPVDDVPRLKSMIEGANVTWTAWESEKLVGIARCLTDFSYVCYVSDLAVDKAYQHQGIGKSSLRS